MDRLDYEVDRIPNEAVRIPVLCLPIHLRTMIGYVLDPLATVTGRDYRMFGEEVGLTQEQVRALRANNNGRSVTEAILEVVDDSLSVWNLICILRRMGVRGVREILQCWPEILHLYYRSQDQLMAPRSGVQHLESSCECSNCRGIGTGLPPGGSTPSMCNSGCARWQQPQMMACVGPCCRDPRQAYGSGHPSKSYNLHEDQVYRRQDQTQTTTHRYIAHGAQARQSCNQFDYGSPGTSSRAEYGRSQSNEDNCCQSPSQGYLGQSPRYAGPPSQVQREVAVEIRPPGQMYESRQGTGGAGQENPGQARLVQQLDTLDIAQDFFAREAFDSLTEDVVQEPSHEASALPMAELAQANRSGSNFLEMANLNNHQPGNHPTPNPRPVGNPTHNPWPEDQPTHNPWPVDQPTHNPWPVDHPTHNPWAGNRPNNYHQQVNQPHNNHQFYHGHGQQWDANQAFPDLRDNYEQTVRKMPYTTTELHHQRQRFPVHQQELQRYHTSPPMVQTDMRYPSPPGQHFTKCHIRGHDGQPLPKLLIPGPNKQTVNQSQTQGQDGQPLGRIPFADPDQQPLNQLQSGGQDGQPLARNQFADPDQQPLNQLLSRGQDGQPLARNQFADPDRELVNKSQDEGQDQQVQSPDGIQVATIKEGPVIKMRESGGRKEDTQKEKEKRNSDPTSSSSYSDLQLPAPESAAQPLEGATGGGQQTRSGQRDSSRPLRRQRSDELVYLWSSDASKVTTPESGLGNFVFVTGGERAQRDRVEAEIWRLCKFLHKHGITVVADLPKGVVTMPSDPLGTRQNVRHNVNEAIRGYFDKATCVILAVSPGYHDYVDRNSQPPSPSSHHVSVRHIYTQMMSEYCNKNFSRNKRFYPVMLYDVGGRREHIPDWLTSTLTYTFPGNRSELVRHLKEDLGIET